MKITSGIFGFIEYVLPARSASPRFYFALLRILLCGRESVFTHFKSLKAATSRGGFTRFVQSVAATRAPEEVTATVPVPARLLARLLRTVYLTEVLPHKNPVKRRAGANDGYINHPHFSYGNSLQSAARSQTRHGDLD